MGWLRDLIFGEPDGDDEYLARLNNNDMVSPQDNRGSRDENNFDKDISEVAADTRKSDSKPQPDQYHSANGQKVIPEIEVERTEAHPSGDNKYLEVWAHIRNHASFDVEIFELRLYRGPMPQSDSVRKMYIQYKIVGTGDYFQADHMIEYKYEQDNRGNKWYMPDELKLLRPVRDI